jgi:hypothetical protein
MAPAVRLEILPCLEAVSRAESHASLCFAVQDAATQLLKASSCALLVTEGVYVRRYVGKGSSPCSAALEDRPAAGIVGQAFRQLCIQACPDTRLDPRFDPDADGVAPEKGQQRVHSILAVPCLGETRLLGVFVCWNSTNEELPFTSAASTATALQMARSISIKLSQLEEKAAAATALRRQQELWRASLDLYNTSCSSNEWALGAQTRTIAKRLLRCGNAAFLIPDTSVASLSSGSIGGASGGEAAGEAQSDSSHDPVLLRNLSREGDVCHKDHNGAGWLDRSRMAAKGVLGRSLSERQSVIVTAEALIAHDVKNALVVPVLRAAEPSEAAQGLHIPLIQSPPLPPPPSLGFCRFAD